MLVNSAAVMQPYLFPNISYYKLVRHVEHFVFYDDVHFIKGGWINKNNILNNGKSLSFTLPLIDASSNKLIRDVEVYNKERETPLLLKKIKYSYSKAPYFNDAFQLIENVLQTPSNFISDLAEQSIRMVFDYLKQPVLITKSTNEHFNRNGNDKTDRLIALIQHLDKNVYLNAIGGKTLYEKDYFKAKGIDLYFVTPSFIPYKQFNHPFVQGLSMIDILMFNSPDNILLMLDDIHYE